MEQLSPPTASPLKRKYNEYHDPDYPDSEATNSKDVQTKRVKLEQSTSFEPTLQPTCSATPDDATERRLNKLREIINREFQNEIVFKQTQLFEINDRLVEARRLLERLRYSIVAEYYRKQSVCLTKTEADAIRGNQSLFSDERAGPQLPLHPSLKNIIGKRPRNYQELMRTNPERNAAVQARKTMRARNPAQRRHERRVNQLIREQGIVIDHSKESEQSNIETHNVPYANIKSEPQDNAFGAIQEEQPSTSKSSSKKMRTIKKETPTGKLLNASRLNNKTKYLFVVGNTSKYIGAEVESAANEFKSGTQQMSHKWLVYVQGKDLDRPVEMFIKKVRFHLHHSYRPNDIVDVCAPPFQIARRGWGEFPMRIQLFFHEELHQKPVQLLHNLILDKTMSGLHTMGAETIVEIWLRTENPTQLDEERVENLTTTSILIPGGSTESTLETMKPRTISITQNKEELDDNLFAFLNNIDMSPDIEKIQPTVVVPEPLACKIKLSSPEKPQTIQHTTTKHTPTKWSTTEQKCFKNDVARDLQQSLLPTITTAKPTVVYLNKSNNGLSFSGKNAKNGIDKDPVQLNGDSTHVKTDSIITQRSIGDSGNVQIVTRSPTSQIPAPINGSAANLRFVNKSSISGHKVTKNYVFQKEGKVYIIDPLQIKLKQAQKQQQSLLKPQVSLLRHRKDQLKQQQQQLEQRLQNLESVTSDHDYAPPPPEVLLRQAAQRQTPAPPPAIITLSHSTLPPPIYEGHRKSDAKRLILEEKQQSFEQQFHQAKFVCMRDAVDFLLRRLPMYAERESLAAAYPFVYANLQKYKSLNPLKQRACEWLRAKFVRNCMHKHQNLYRLHESGTDQYWSIREIMIYARLHAYTPLVKPLSLEKSQTQSKPFSELVQHAVKQETIQYETLTTVAPITTWADKMSLLLKNYEYSVSDNQTIDIVNVPVSTESQKPTNVLNEAISMCSSTTQIFYLPPLAQLEHTNQLIDSICKETELKLAPEELVPGVLHPAALTTLSQALKIFIEKLLREAIAAKQQLVECGTTSSATIGDALPKGAAGLMLEPKDIGRVIAQQQEFDFLTNCQLGESKP